MSVYVMDLVRVTEAAAIAASKWVGTGDKLSADKAATEAMQDRLNRMAFAAKIMIGEGRKDDSYGLFYGDLVGKDAGKEGEPVYEIAVDPIDGTRPTVASAPEALSVLALADENALFTTGEYYMNKLACGPDIERKARLSLSDPPSKTIEKVSRATGKDPGSIVVCLLERPRHDELVRELRRIGVRIKLIMDCDISGAIATCLPESGIDLLMGIGGAPEGVISACAMKCLAGGFQARIVEKDGRPLDKKILGISDMVRGHCAFAASGITNGSLLKGVRYTEKGPVTNSVVMRSESGTVRWITAYHGN